MGKTKQKYNRKGKSSSGTIRVKQTLTQLVTVSSGTAVLNIGTVAASSGGIWAGFESLTELADMFRLERINRVVFEFGPSTAIGSVAVNFPSGMLYFKYTGQNAPTTLSDIETPHVSRVSAPFSALAAAGSEPLTKAVNTTLKLRNKDMPILAGTSDPGWLATQNDGTASLGVDYGTLFYVLLSTTTASNVVFFLRSYIDVEFKDILDPTTISTLLTRYPSGLPPHVEVPPGFVEGCVASSLRVPRPLALQKPASLSYRPDIGVTPF